MFPSIGPMGLTVVLVVGLIVLRPGCRAVGRRGLREFRGAISGGNGRDEDAHAERELGMTPSAEPVA